MISNIAVHVANIRMIQHTALLCNGSLQCVALNNLTVDITASYEILLLS